MTYHYSWTCVNWYWSRVLFCLAKYRYVCRQM